MDEDVPPPHAAVGLRIRHLREAKGISRQDLAATIKVDVSSLVGWEAGKRLPRDKQRAPLARALGCDLDALFPSTINGASVPAAVSLVDTLEHLPNLLMDCTRNTRRTLRALRLSAPYTTPAYIQTEWRMLVDERLLGGTLEVQRIEIFYNLKRLQETLSNIFRYDGRAYYVKSYCAGLTEVAPFMGGYFFDDDEFVLGAYWTGIPPHHRPGLRMSGQPFRTFFSNYWDEIWRRGTLLNIRGAHDLSAVQAVAKKLGLPLKQWKRFVEEAREFKMGDGAPPLI